MNDIIRAQHPHEILQLAPVIAGGRPTNSALVLLFCGKRSGAALRIDLPDSETDASDWAHVALVSAAQVGADGIVVILYPGRDIGAGPLPYAQLAHALSQVAREYDVILRDSFIVGDDYWGDYRRPEAPQAPAVEVTGLDERFAWLPPVDDMVTGPDGVPPTLPQEQEKQQYAVVQSLVDDESVVDPIALTARAVMAGPAGLDDCTAAKLSSLAQLPLTRELVLTTMIAGAAKARLLEMQPGVACAAAALETRETTARILMGASGEVSSGALQRSLRLWEAVTARTITDQRAPVLGILAWLHWATGKRSIAAACAERAIELDGAVSLAHSVLQLTDSQVIPDWYRDRVQQSVNLPA